MIAALTRSGLSVLNTERHRNPREIPRFPASIWRSWLPRGQSVPRLRPMKWQRLLWIAAPVVLAGLLLGTYLTLLPQAVERTRRSSCGLSGLESYAGAEPPLSLRLVDLEGEPYVLEKLRGRLVLMNLWLTTCDPCLEELPALIELASRYSTRGLALVLVATDKDAKTVKDFIAKVPRLKSLPSNAFILHDPAGKIARKLGTEKYPETYLIEPDGRWGGRIVGARTWTERAVVDCLSGRLP